ncbi:MAG: carboxypeptidase-like regulatory domain-containing protein, partial [Planctomycetota bacterium]|nr:carboxypeptidase-like regulatory domain-containing protein [Planctomycetota bacterium]
MSHKPGGTAVILFVVVAVVLWGIVAYLEAPTMRRRHGDPAIAPTDGSGSGERRGVRRGAAATPGVSRLLADEFAAPPPPGAPLLAGVVTDPSGHPLPDAEVRLGQQETRTDESGRFALVAARARLRIALDG